MKAFGKEVKIVKGESVFMKLIRVFACLLAVASLLTCFSTSLAAEKALTISYVGEATLKENQSAPMLKTKVQSTASGTIVYSLTDTVAKSVVYTETQTGIVAGQEITWSAPYYTTGLTAEKPIRRLRASFVMDGQVYTYDLYYTLHPKDQTVTIERNAWYPNNTACSFGPAFRDVRPGMTDKWYTFTPVNLSIPGRQVFEYIASNMYVIGEVYVDVKGDSVTVTYHNFYDQQSGNTETLSEYFTFFHDLNSVTEVEPENMPASAFAFGRPLSIEQDLGGDTNVLLFVRNRVTYCTYVNDSHKLVRYWPNLPQRVEKRTQMLAMMEK